MPSKYTTVKVRLSVDISKQVKDQVEEAANKEHITATEWITSAILGRLYSTDSALGPLAGLKKDDIRRVRNFIDCLREAPENAGFRKAVDANFAWLIESCKGLNGKDLE